jgi:hypothetical protein
MFITKQHNIQNPNSKSKLQNKNIQIEEEDRNGEEEDGRV